MWVNDDDKILDLVEVIETQSFSIPFECPICGHIAAHIYLHKREDHDNRASLWCWCSECQKFGHISYHAPGWWENCKQIDSKNLSVIPVYLEDEKGAIDLHLTYLRDKQER